MKNNWYGRILSLIWIAIPFNAFATCDDGGGDCCRKDSDCTAYAYEALCAVIPLNKETATKLSKERLPRSGICTEMVIAEMKAEAAKVKVFCDEGACEITE